MEKTIDIPSILIDLRKSNGLTQKQVAQKLWIKPGTYNSWECGRATPSIGLLIRISKVYGLSGLDELLGISEDQAREEIVDRFFRAPEKIQEIVRTALDLSC